MEMAKGKHAVVKMRLFEEVLVDRGRGLHSSTLPLNLSRF
jgi:hypothetical protein